MDDLLPIIPQFDYQSDFAIFKNSEQSSDNVEPRNSLELLHSSPNDIHRPMVDLHNAGLPAG
jgi:hypothetical protein